MYKPKARGLTGQRRQACYLNANGKAVLRTVYAMPNGSHIVIDRRQAVEVVKGNGLLTECWIKKAGQ